MSLASPVIAMRLLQTSSVVLCLVIWQSNFALNFAAISFVAIASLLIRKLKVSAVFCALLILE